MWSPYLIFDLKNCKVMETALFLVVLSSRFLVLNGIEFQYHCRPLIWLRML